MISREAKIRKIRQHIRGFQTPAAVIDCVDELCDIIGELSGDVQLLMSEVQKEVPVSTGASKMPSTEMPITKNKRNIKSSKSGTTTKKTKPVEDT